MQGKQYALIVVCKQFLDADDYELQMEDSEEWIVDDMFGCAEIWNKGTQDES